MRFPGCWREGWLILSAVAMVALPVLVNHRHPEPDPAESANRRADPGADRGHDPASNARLPSAACRPVLLPAIFLAISLHSAATRVILELATYIEARLLNRNADRLVIVAAQPWEIIPINYYLLERHATWA